MKIDKITIGATIPVAQYANIMPEITMSDIDLNESEFGLNYIKQMFARFSEKGSLNDKEVKELIKQSIVKKSFNENIDINFEPVLHSYTYKGKTMKAVTEYIKKFYKQFDSEKISEASAKAWKVDKELLKELWEENGKLASLFGTLVHKGIENHYKFKDIGNSISNHKELEDNYAIPKHPILKSIIEGFINIDKAKSNVKSEVLLTDIENDLCGQTDILEIIDETKKICRIGDIKVNINSEEETKDYKPLPPFDKLPSNKLTKYQLQMSVYANMLQKSGWTVTGLDVYVYEDTWKYYKLDVLKVIE